MAWDDWSAIEAAQARAEREDEERRNPPPAPHLRVVRPDPVETALERVERPQEPPEPVTTPEVPPEPEKRALTLDPVTAFRLIAKATRRTFGP